MVQKCQLFVNVHTIEIVNAGLYVGGQKRKHSVNVNCEELKMDRNLFVIVKKNVM